MVLNRLSILLALMICFTLPSRASELAAYFDETTGVELSIPKSLSGTATRATHGLNWRSRDGSISLDTLRFPAERSMDNIRNKLKSVPGRVISLEQFTRTALHLEGRDQGATNFIIHIEMKDDATKGGASIVFSDTGGKALATTARMIANSLKLVSVESLPETAMGTPRPPSTREIPYRCHLTTDASRLASSDVHIRSRSPREASVPVGTPTKISWEFNGRLDPTCGTPLYLVISSSDRTRFEGEGFLAIAKGAPGPFDIGFNTEKTRLFFPLHQLKKRSGEFLIKSFEIGPLALEWALVEVPLKVAKPKSRADYALGNEVAVRGGLHPEVAVYRAAAPHMVVRDNFSLEQPKKILRANSGEFELHIFDRFYRVLDARTRELLAEKSGIDPNFSPSGRFLAAYVEAGRSLHKFSKLDSPNIEVIDLYSLHTIVGIKPIFVAWALGDSFMLPAEVPCVRNSCSASLAGC